MLGPWQVVLRDLCGGVSVTLLLLAGKPVEWAASPAEGNLREKQVSQTLTVAATEEEVAACAAALEALEERRLPPLEAVLLEQE